MVPRREDTCDIHAGRSCIGDCNPIKPRGGPARHPGDSGGHLVVAAGYQPAPRSIPRRPRPPAGVNRRGRPGRFQLLCAHHTPRYRFLLAAGGPHVRQNHGVGPKPFPASSRTASQPQGRSVTPPTRRHIPPDPGSKWRHCREDDAGGVGGAAPVPSLLCPAGGEDFKSLQWIFPAVAASFSHRDVPQQGAALRPSPSPLPAAHPLASFLYFIPEKKGRFLFNFS